MIYAYCWFLAGVMFALVAAFEEPIDRFLEKLEKKIRNKRL